MDCRERSGQLVGRKTLAEIPGDFLLLEEYIQDLGRQVVRESRKGRQLSQKMERTSQHFLYTSGTFHEGSVSFLL